METNTKVKIAGLLTLAVLPISSEARGYCYGYTCPEPAPVNNCAEEVINANLAKLKSLNIVQVNGLAPIACFGYHLSCGPEREQAEPADRCEKAEALAKAVQLLEPLKVPLKP